MATLTPTSPSKDLTKQEGHDLRHLLRLILLLEEFEQLTPPEVDATTWKVSLKEIADKLTDICRQVDPTSTEEAIKKAHAADVVEGEGTRRRTATAPEQPPQPAEPRRKTPSGGDRRLSDGPHQQAEGQRSSAADAGPSPDSHH